MDDFRISSRWQRNYTVKQRQKEKEITENENVKKSIENFHLRSPSTFGFGNEKTDPLIFSDGFKNHWATLESDNRQANA